MRRVEAVNGMLSCSASQRGPWDAIAGFPPRPCSDADEFSIPGTPPEQRLLRASHVF